MDKAILAADELVGFITAVALVQPSKRVADVKVSSVKKKLKDKAFARSVNREDIYLGMADLGLALDDHIDFTIQAMTAVAGVLVLLAGRGGSQELPHPHVLLDGRGT